MWVLWNLYFRTEIWPWGYYHCCGLYWGTECVHKTSRTAQRLEHWSAEWVDYIANNSSLVSNINLLILLSQQCWSQLWIPKLLSWSPWCGKKVFVIYWHVQWGWLNSTTHSFHLSGQFHSFKRCLHYSSLRGTAIWLNSIVKQQFR